MNEFLKSLTAYGMEGMNAEEVFVEEYANSECAEELIELDNLDQACVAMESMSDAIMEGGLEMQTLALEAAGFTLDTASGFTGELSNEAVGNMVKRGYYEVKIQVKKALQKIWKLVLSAVDSLLGSDGRLKSYGKLFKKYKERLNKINPKETKDNEDKEVTIREWDKSGTLEILLLFKGVASTGWMKAVTNEIKEKDPIKAINGFRKAIDDGFDGMENLLAGITSKTEARKLTKAGRKAMPQLTEKAADKIEAWEKTFEENMEGRDSDLKDLLKDFLTEFKDVDSSDYNIYDAKNMLVNLGGRFEEECKKDLKFKKELIKMRKAWDKYTGEWDMNKVDDKVEEGIKRGAAAILRVLNKCGKYITGFRLGLSKVYSAIVSNLQGVLADMAKVISKGTNIGA